MYHFRKSAEDQLLDQLSQCEYIYEKTRIASKMNEQELENYGKLATNIKNEIEQTKDEIQSAKEKLQEAKIFRKNRMEYEVIANVIDQHPERKDTHQKLTAIKKELGNLEVSSLFKCDSFLLLPIYEVISFSTFRKLNKCSTAKLKCVANISTS